MSRAKTLCPHERNDKKVMASGKSIIPRNNPCGGKTNTLISNIDLNVPRYSSFFF